MDVCKMLLAKTLSTESAPISLSHGGNLSAGRRRGGEPSLPYRSTVHRDGAGSSLLQHSSADICCCPSCNGTDVLEEK